MPLSSTPIQARTVLRQETAPGDTGLLWLDTTTEPATLKIYDSAAGEWGSVAATTTDETEVLGGYQPAIRQNQTEVSIEATLDGITVPQFTYAGTGTITVRSPEGDLQWVENPGTNHQGQTYTFTARHVDSIECTNNGDSEVDAHYVTLVGHSHSISPGGA